MKYTYEKRMPGAKPCPFCGSEEIVTESREHFEESFYKTCCLARCAECGAQIVGEPVMKKDGTYIEDYDTAQSQALRMWNRRTA